MPPHTLPPTRRMRRRGEFQRVFDAGRRVHGRYLTVVFAPAPGAAARLGIVASRKVGGAVVRNRAKRLIREAFRTSTGRLPPMDLVVIAKSTVVGVAAVEFERDFRSTIMRLNLSKQ